MSQLTRRNFLKALAGLPALALFKPKAAEAAELDLSAVALDSLEGEEDGYFELVEGEPVQAKALPLDQYAKILGLEFGRDGSLYIRGDFLEETPEEVRQRHWDYIKRVS